MKNLSEAKLREADQLRANAARKLEAAAILIGDAAGDLCFIEGAEYQRHWEGICKLSEQVKELAAKVAQLPTPDDLFTV